MMLTATRRNPRAASSTSQAAALSHPNTGDSKTYANSKQSRRKKAESVHGKKVAARTWRHEKSFPRGGSSLEPTVGPAGLHSLATERQPRERYPINRLELGFEADGRFHESSRKFRNRKERVSVHESKETNARSEDGGELHEVESRVDKEQDKPRTIMWRTPRKRCVRTS